MNFIRTGQQLIALVAVCASFYVEAQSVGSASVAASAPVAAASAGKSSSKAEDRALRRRILNALDKTKGLRAGGITVRVTDGDVRLEGWVPEQAQIEQATRVTQGVQGVKSVRNTLTLSTF